MGTQAHSCKACIWTTISACPTNSSCIVLSVVTQQLFPSVRHVAQATCCHWVKASRRPHVHYLKLHGKRHSTTFECCVAIAAKQALVTKQETLLSNLVCAALLSKHQFCQLSCLTSLEGGMDPVRWMNGVTCVTCVI